MHPESETLYFVELWMILTSTPDICVGVKEITNVSTAGCDALIWQYQIGNGGLGGRNFIFQKNKKTGLCMSFISFDFQKWLADEVWRKHFLFKNNIIIAP